MAMFNVSSQQYFLNICLLLNWHEQFYCFKCHRLIVSCCNTMFTWLSQEVKISLSVESILRSIISKCTGESILREVIGSLVILVSLYLMKRTLSWIGYLTLALIYRFTSWMGYSWFYCLHRIVIYSCSSRII